MTRLLDLYADHAAGQPDDPAIVYRRDPHAGHTLTWVGLWERADEIRALLRRDGLRDRCVIGLVLSDGPDFVPALVALWRLGCAPLLLDPRWGDRLTRTVLAHATPAAVVSVEPTVTTVHQDFTAPSVAPSDTAFIGYTSGSTGDPKAIVFAHERLYRGTLGNAAASTRLHGTPPARLGLSMRLSGSGMINVHHTWAVVLGACVVVLPELTVSTVREYWTHVQDHGIEQAFLVPQHVEMVNRFAADRDTNRRGPIAFTGTAPLPRRTHARFQRRFGVPLFNAYGLSETSSAAFFGHRGPDGLATESIGVPERVAARLRDAEGRVLGGAGEGELELAGDQVFDGYFRNPAATDEVLGADGWLRTGDMVRRDGAGLYFLVGRKKNAVMKGGYAIYLSEVEEAAAAHPDVLEAAAVPVRLTDDAEEIGCLVRLVDGGVAGEDDLLAWLREALGVQRAPCRVVVTDRPLPRGGPDKLDRPGITGLWNSLPNVLPGFVLS